MDIWNNITPNFGPFAPILQEPVGVLLAAAWALGFVVLGFFLIESLVRMGKARRANVPDVYEDAKSGLFWPAVGIIALAALPVIWAVLTGI